MGLKIQSVKDAAFVQYGRIADGYDYEELLCALNKTDVSENVEYIPSVASLEATACFKQMTDNVYGGMPIQIGYCNGVNSKLNCVEYHRDSEINIVANDIILLVGRQQDIIDGKFDSSKIEAFLCPAGTAVELYATTLHYAPCSATKDATFRVAVVLPKGTNTDMPVLEIKNEEDKRLFARNKWLLAHKDTNEAKQGAVIGVVGDNIDLY